MKKFPIQLRDDLVVVAPEDRPNLGGVITPDWTRSLRGEVLAIGPTVTEINLGDVVGFVATAGMEAMFDSKPIRIMREENIEYVVDEA